MREVNFLPAWYPKVIRQRKLFATQATVSALLLVAAGAVLATMHARSGVVSKELALAQERAAQTVKAVRQLDEMLDLQRQLNAKRAIVNELGLPVELSRVLAEIGSCTPREVTFTAIDATTVEQSATSIADRAAAAVAGRPTTRRRLELRLRGIAPTESEVTTFWSRLIQRPFLQQVRLVNSTEKVEGEHKMREFEITLNIPLDAQEGA